jgi:hypothetical protein
MAHPRLGRKLLAKFRVTFDFQNRLVYLERAAPPQSAESGPEPG